MFTNVNVDCCKTPGCKNLGLLNSQDYVAQGKNILCRECGGNDSNLLIVFYVQIMPDDFVMQLHRF